MRRSQVSKLLNYSEGAALDGAPYDLAILDLLMPEMDGFELASAIKADQSISGVRLVMLTSAGVRGDSTTARQASVAEYLTKPCRQSQLFDCLTRVVGLASLSKDAPVSTLVTGHTLREAQQMSPYVMNLLT
jgi:CheY-like chemotaxis protein